MDALLRDARMNRRSPATGADRQIRCRPQVRGPGAPAPASAPPEATLAGALRALHVDGDLRSSRPKFEAVYRSAEAEGDPETMAQAALGLCGLWVHEQRGAIGGVQVESRLRHALALIEPDSALALRIRSRLAGEAEYRVGGHAAVLAALAEARRSEDRVAIAEAASLAHHCMLGPDHAEQRRALADELIAAALGTHRRGDLLLGLLWRTVDALLEGHPHADRSLAELRELLAGRPHLAIGFVVEAIEVMLAIRSGRFDRAETLAERCAELGAMAGDADATGWYGAQLIAIRWYQGRIGELVPTLRDLAQSPTLSTVDNAPFGALAVAAATAGDRRQASWALARLGAPDLELPRSSSWLVALYGAVEAAALLGDEDTAASAYRILSPYAELPMLASLGVACFGSVQQALGVAALTLRDTERAAQHLRAAVDANNRLGHWPAAALAQSRLAKVLAGGAETRAGSPAPPATAVTTRRTSPPLLVLRQRRGRHWEIELGARRALVDGGLGMTYLATLLANPGREVRAVDMVVGPRRHKAETDAATGPRQAVLDESAMRAYRRRLAELAADIEQYEANNDAGHVAKLRTERDWLLAELTAATGLGGRVRQFANPEERARISVGKAIRRAIDRVATIDPVIGAELRATVQTGLRCCYRPA